MDQLVNAKKKLLSDMEVMVMYQSYIVNLLRLDIWIQAFFVWLIPYALKKFFEWLRG